MEQNSAPKLTESYFEILPSEIRLVIYAHLRDDDVVHLQPRSPEAYKRKVGLREKSFFPNAADVYPFARKLSATQPLFVLLRVCKLTRNEVQPLMYAKISVPFDLLCSFQTTFLPAIGKTNQRCIQELTIEFAEKEINRHSLDINRTPRLARPSVSILALLESFSEVLHLRRLNLLHTAKDTTTDGQKMLRAAAFYMEVEMRTIQAALQHKDTLTAPTVTFGMCCSIEVKYADWDSGNALIPLANNGYNRLSEDHRIIFFMGAQDPRRLRISSLYQDPQSLYQGSLEDITTDGSV